jgi:hypothetical protein
MTKLFLIVNYWDLKMAKLQIYIEPSEEVKEELMNDAATLREFIQSPDPVETAVLKLANELDFPYFETLLSSEHPRNKAIGQEQLSEAMNQVLILADFLAGSIELCGVTSVKPASLETRRKLWSRRKTGFPK